LNYYVYYKVDPVRLEEVRSRVEKLFGAVEQECGVRGRWMRRRDDPATYMEVYEDVADQKVFEEVLLRNSKELPAPRKLECFQCA